MSPVAGGGHLGRVDVLAPAAELIAVQGRAHRLRSYRAASNRAGRSDELAGLDDLDVG